MVDTMPSIVDTITEHIHPFVPVPEKIDLLVEKLNNEYLWLSDEYRNEGRMYQILSHYFAAPDCKVYEWGDFDAVFIVSNIVPGWKADFSFKLVNPGVWSSRFVRECKEFLTGVMSEFKLFRIATSTPDARVMKMARMVGFEPEGTHYRAFGWNGTYYDDTLLCIFKED